MFRAVLLRKSVIGANLLSTLDVSAGFLGGALSEVGEAGIGSDGEVDSDGGVVETIDSEEVVLRLNRPACWAAASLASSGLWTKERTSCARRC